VQKDAQENLVKLSYNVFLLEAFAIWMERKDKSFFSCFQESLRKHQVEFKLDGEMRKFPDREILKVAIDSVKSTAVVQMLCYVYELLYKNYDPALSNDKAEFEKIKVNILHGANNSFNNEQLLNHIRNAISHNDDMDSPCYNYSMISDLFTFLPTKKNRENNSTRVTISEKDLADLMVHYIKNINGYKQLDYIIDIDTEKIKSSRSISRVQDFIKLRNKQTGEIIFPDENQKKVIKELIEQIRSGFIKENDNINFFYPYKQNVLNNFIRISDLYHLLNCLYKLRSEDFYGFIEKSSMYTPSGLSELKNFGDISSMFITNRFFQIFSTTTNKSLQQTLSETSQYLKLGKLRNAIMHGTYYKDFDAGLYIYDAPRESKTEEELVFVDSFSAQDLEMLSMMLFMAKDYSSKR